MLSRVWSSAGYEQWKAMLISIENLLEYLLYIGFDYDLQLTRH
jgi:hypothetical protein